MAFPVTITGISLDVPTAGPFQSADGNFYFFGRDASVNTTLQCYKSTDPANSWSSIASDDGFGGQIINIAGYQVGDIVHLVICYTVTEYSFAFATYEYRTFDMSSDSFVLSETIASHIQAGILSYTMNVCSLVVRSTGSPVVLFQGDTTGRTGHYTIFYSRRLGTNSWSSPVEVDDAASSVNYMYPVAILGDSDEVQFIYFSLGNTFQKALASNNTLKAATTATSHMFSEGISFDLSGTTKCIAAGRDANLVLYFDAGDSPTLHTVSLAGANILTIRLFELNGVAYVLYNKTVGLNHDYYFRSSSDGGATWDAEVFICHSTNNGLFQGTSRFGKTYATIDDLILPFIYTDGSDLKHNQKIVSTTSVDIDLVAAHSTAAIAAVSKTIQKGNSSAIGSAVAATVASPQISFPAIAASASGQLGSLIAEGADITINLASAAFAVGAAELGLSRGGEATARTNLTRLGPGGYPIASLAGAAAAFTDVTLFSINSSGSPGDFSGYEFSLSPPAAFSTAGSGLPIWTNSGRLTGVISSGQTANLGRQIETAALASAATSAANAELTAGNITWFDFPEPIATVAADFVPGVGPTLDYASSITAVGDFAPYAFTGTSVALQSATTTGIADPAIPLNESILQAASAYAANNILHMEGDEAISLAEAAATGTVGDLLVAIVIPPAIKWLVCASIDFAPEVAADVSMHPELQAVLAINAIQGRPQIDHAVDGALEIATIVSGTPSMKEC